MIFNKDILLTISTSLFYLNTVKRLKNVFEKIAQSSLPFAKQNLKFLQIIHEKRYHLAIILKGTKVILIYSNYDPRILKWLTFDLKRVIFLPPYPI